MVRVGLPEIAITIHSHMRRSEVGLQAERDCCRDEGAAAGRIHLCVQFGNRRVESVSNDLAQMPQADATTDEWDVSAHKRWDK